MDQEVIIKFSGGRKVQGVLRGADQLLNLVLDNVKEFERHPTSKDGYHPTNVRELGTVVARGQSILSVIPV